MKITAEQIKNIIWNQDTVWEADRGKVCYGVMIENESYMVQIAESDFCETLGITPEESDSDDYDRYLSTPDGIEVCEEIADMINREDIAPEGYRVEISHWEDGSGYSFTETVDNFDDRFPDDYEAKNYAKDYNCKSGDRVEVINNDTDDVVDSYIVK